MDEDISRSALVSGFHEDGAMNLLSIVIPCYNDHAYITTAVNSALQQTYTNKEILIVDDGSTAKTKKVLKELESEKIKVITQTNQGPSAARNRGIESANGRYVLVLDSDDFFEPQFSEKAIEIINSQPNIKLVTCYGRWFISEKKSVTHKPAGGNINNFLYECGAFGSTLFLKKDWEFAGGYDHTMRLGYEDWEYYIRLLEGGGEAHVIPEVLFHYRNKKTSRNSQANDKKYKIWNYIFHKHSKHYIEDFDRFVNRMTFLLEQQEDEKKKLRNKLDFRIGYYLLFPVRKIKHFLSSGQ